MSVKDRLSGVVDRVLNIKHVQFDRLFTLLLLTFIVIILGDTFWTLPLVRSPEYRFESILFPAVIGVPTLFLLLALLAMQTSGRLNALASKYTAAGLFEMDMMDEIDKKANSGGGTERSIREERLDVLQISLWTLVFFGIILLIGFLPGTLVFLIAYYRLQAEQTIPRTLLYSLLMWLFVIVIFDMVLNTPFYTGVLGIELPLPT